MARIPYTKGKEFTVPKSGLFAPDPTTGYDIKAVKLGKGREEERIAGLRNAELHNGDEWIRFFSQEISLGAALAGSTAQSRYVRDFYPHNIKIPSVIVSGEALNQEEYATIVEFIHQSQIRAVQGEKPLKLYIAAGGTDLGPSFRGAHEPLIALGYVQAVTRKHERFVPAPKFSFEFILVKMEKGIFSDIQGEDLPAKTWLEIIESLIEHKVEPTAAQVAGAEKKAVRVINESSHTILEYLEGF